MPPNISITNFAKNSIRIIPFGGCGEFGMNMTGYICDDRFYLVDAGISFPDPGKLGIDCLFPDLEPWLKQFGGIYAYIITHGHEDHIGALPFLVERWPGPIYATPWTAALIENKFERRRISTKYPIFKVAPGDVVECEDFSIEYVPFNHSIPEACGLMIRQGSFNIFHTGDFKFDFTPVIEKPVDLKYLEKIGKEGIHLLLADSTNSHVPGFCPSETDVVIPMQQAFVDAGEGAVVVTTFSSNFWRLKTILDTCVSTGRKAFILGGGIENCLRIASDLNFYKAPANLIVDQQAAQNLPRSQLCVIATGSQGEWRSALMRIAKGEHRQFSITPGDLVVFSSRTIPGNERVIQQMMSFLERRGARIFSVRQNPLIHVSGHGYREELRSVIKLLNPRHFIPVHGTFSHLSSHSKIPAELGLTTTQSTIIENGDVIDVTADRVAISDRIDIDALFVDSESLQLLPFETMRQRLRIGELGLVIIQGATKSNRSKLACPPVVTIQGLIAPYGMTEGEFIKEISDAAVSGFRKWAAEPRGSAEEQMRQSVRRYLSQELRKKPVVICSLLEV